MSLESLCTLAVLVQSPVYFRVLDQIIENVFETLFCLYCYIEQGIFDKEVEEEYLGTKIQLHGTWSIY